MTTYPYTSVYNFTFRGEDEEKRAAGIITGCHFYEFSGRSTLFHGRGKLV